MYTPNDHYFNVGMCVDKMSFVDSHIDYIVDNMRHDLADRIVKTRFKRTDEDFHIKFEMGVYVFNPDEFWQIVQREATRIAIDLNRS